MKELNLNNMVKVKLTEIGVKKWLEQADILGQYNQNMCKELQICFLSKIDDEGYLETELWQLMHVFGPFIYHGMNLSAYPFESMKILINENELGEPGTQRKL